MCRRCPGKADAALLLQIAAVLTAFTSIRATDYYVDPADGKAFATVQAAVDAVDGQSEFDRANIFIAPGVYREIVVVEKPYVSFIGTGVSPEATSISFARGIISGAAFNWGQVVEIRPAATAFMARNLTVENSTLNRVRIQALAVRCAADRAVFDNVRFLGYQDTLMVDAGTRQYFRGCFITGDADFIFGDATAVFDHCTIQSTDSEYITAADTKRITANGLIFLDCFLVAGSDRDPGSTAHTFPAPNSVYLGRPWLLTEPDTMPSVIFIRTRMGGHIIAAGWDPWAIGGIHPSINRDPLTRYSEFGSMDLNGNPLPDSNGDGTPNGRVSWADPMTAEQADNYTLEHIFGPADFWDWNTQPEASGVVYESQGDPWNPLAQLAFLPSESGAASTPLNISTRLDVQTGDNVLIAGFILKGTEAAKVLLRALGPSLEGADVDDPLADPVLDLRAADGSRIAFNNNWRYAQEADIVATGIPPSDNHEAAILATLAPGAYTAIVRGRGATSGVALIELYALSGARTGELANISTRGFIKGGDRVMIAGFILAGGSGGSTVMIRALGPSLEATGIPQPLADPTLELHDGNGVAIAFNDNWRDTQPSEITDTGIPPSDERESAILAMLPPGPYTAVLTGADGGAGVALIEVYNLGSSASGPTRLPAQ